MFTFPNHKTFLLHKAPKSQHYNTRNPNFLPIESCSSLQNIQKNPNSKHRDPNTNDDSSPFPPIGTSKRVVLVRHGQSTWNEEGRIQGSSDFSVLTQKGETQAQTSRQMLVNDAFDVCFASPLARSRRTAEIIWDTRKKRLIMDYDLREIDLYSFQGLLKNEGKTKFGETYLIWQKDAPNFNIDGHYPLRELWDRARKSWTRILNHDGESMLVVAHNAVNQALIATAIGLGTEYFRVLVQSNCGVTVLDFTPQDEGGAPHIRLNRLNQTPYSPLQTTTSDGRKSSKRMILACHGPTQRSTEKTANLLQDLKVSSIVCSTSTASIGAANAISKVQEFADCLGSNNIPGDAEMKPLQDLEVESILWRSKKDLIDDSQLLPGWLNGLDDEEKTKMWSQTGKAWKALLNELSNESEAEQNLVVVGHPAVHIALIGHCLNLTKEWMGSFHLDAGSISVLDFPDGPDGIGIIRCVNYTAHLGRWSIPVTRPIA